MESKAVFNVAPASEAQSLSGSQTGKPESQEPPTAEERSLRRIRELTNQRDELRHQIEDQRQHISVIRHQGIETAIQEFLGFYSGYTDYFWRGMEEGKFSGRNVTSESVLCRALNNMRSVWEQLSIAINQRYNPVYKDRLAVADAKASQLMARTGAMKIVHGLPILYYNKKYQISRHPFQAFPLLGISPDIRSEDGQTSFLQEDASLAHELGHHVFWNNGELDEYAARLDEIDTAMVKIVLADYPFKPGAAARQVRLRDIHSSFITYSTWMGWIEETFADVFGTLIIGPRFAKSAQDVLIREGLGRPSDLIASDGEHPVPALRPYISLETLRFLAESCGDRSFKEQLDPLIDALKTRWYPIWKEAGHEEQTNLETKEMDSDWQHTHDSKALPPKLNDLKELIPAVVSHILTGVQFVASAGKNQYTANLLSVLEYWGKTPDQSHINEINELSQSLANDKLSTLATRSAGGLGDIVRSPVAQDTTSFDKFLAFVQRQREQHSGDYTNQPDEWQTVLRFNLTLDHGADPVCHKHTDLYGTIRC